MNKALYFCFLLTVHTTIPACCCRSSRAVDLHAHRPFLALPTPQITRATTTPSIATQYNERESWLRERRDIKLKGPSVAVEVLFIDKTTSSVLLSKNKDTLGWIIPGVYMRSNDPEAAAHTLAGLLGITTDTFHSFYTHSRIEIDPTTKSTDPVMILGFVCTHYCGNPRSSDPNNIIQQFPCNQLPTFQSRQTTAERLIAKAVADFKN